MIVPLAHIRIVVYDPGSVTIMSLTELVVKRDINAKANDFVYENHM